ncbi:phospholipase A and acyltransferase 1-like [Branchiostoma floridae x Branchiostoma belcheri]
MAYSLSGSLSKRKGKAHWAVYVGGEKVIHLAGNSDALSAGIRSSAEQAVSLSTIFGVVSDAGKIMEDSFWDVVGDSIVKINNYKDTSKCVQSGRAILKRARSKLGEVGYNALWNNCEHFATWCRYGEGDSKQAKKAITAGIYVGAVVAGLGALWLSSGTDRKEKRGK